MEKDKRFVAASFEKLDDASLESISGGIEPATIGSILVWTSVGSAFSSLGCSLISTACRSKAKSEKKKGDRESACRLEKMSDTFHDMSIGAGGLCVLSTGGLGVMEVIHRCSK